MKLRRLTYPTGAALTVGAMVIALGAATPNAVAVPAPDPDVRTVAARNADAVVAARPAYLHVGGDERFVRGNVISSSGLHYIPYARTYRGLPVVGGDFVLVADRSGRVVSNSVAMTRPIGALSTTATVSAREAAAIATKQMTTVSKVEDTRLIVYALGASPRLAWQSTMDGLGGEGPSRLTVTVEHGVATVFGSLTAAADEQAMRELVARVPGIVSVVSHVEVETGAEVGAR